MPGNHKYTSRIYIRPGPLSILSTVSLHTRSAQYLLPYATQTQEKTLNRTNFLLESYR